MSEQVGHHLAGQREAILDRLLALLRLPSVSTDPAYADGMAAARDFLCDRLRAIGLKDVQLLDGGGQPAIYASWLGAPEAGQRKPWAGWCAAPSGRPPPEMPVAGSWSSRLSQR